MNRIVRKERLAPGIVLMDVEAPLVARRAMPGQFVMVRADAEGERIPLTVADFDRGVGTITIIFQEVGASTRAMGALEAGQSLSDFAGPLGKPSLPSEGIERVLCIGGGLGTAVVYPQVKLLHQKGLRVDVIVGARSEQYVILEEEIRAHCDNLYITTDDGSYARRGFVTQVLAELLEAGEKYDEVIAIGPLPMMKAVCNITREWGVHTMVSMNPIMVDGTGMCGGCRLTVGGQVRYACVDGPDFDGHLVDFDEAMRRQQIYKQEEAVANEQYHPCGGVFHGNQL